MTAGQAVTKPVSLNSCRLPADLSAGCFALRTAVQGGLSKPQGRAAAAVSKSVASGSTLLCGGLRHPGSILDRRQNKADAVLDFTGLSGHGGIRQ